ncbi:hypothetical protein KA005_14130, partial [bacterium]|nr:hypothetical protein [bacterium]
MVKIINRETIKDLRVKQNRSDLVQIFQGDKKLNLSSGDPKFHGEAVVVPMKNSNYVNSAGYHKLWNEIKELREKYNAAQSPSAATLEALLGKVFIDITRRAQEAGDLTSFFATEINDLEAAETINTRYIKKYIGEMGLIAGSNDSVNLIEQNLATTDTFDLAIYAIGWKDSLKNMLFNKLHEMQKVNQAAVDADTDRRNAAIVGTIVGATFVASQKQAADATSGATFDILMYNTLRKGVKKLRGLKDPQTGRKIAVPKISILCNSANTWDIERVINGQLTNGGATGTLTTQNAQALPIANIIEYDQGITDGFVWGKKTLDFPGVTAGKCYLFIPLEYLWVVNKRPLTLETGVGSTLQLSTEERAWYRVF